MCASVGWVVCVCAPLASPHMRVYKYGRLVRMCVCVSVGWVVCVIYDVCMYVCMYVCVGAWVGWCVCVWVVCMYEICGCDVHVCI